MITPQPSPPIIRLKKVFAVNDNSPPTDLDDLVFDEFFIDGHCGLCGNSGVVETTPTTPRGRKLALRAHCICANGRTMKKLGHVL
jgi:delta-aminolevulinic acid dehydratase/porphobilinogen synthase